MIFVHIVKWEKFLSCKLEWKDFLEIVEETEKSNKLEEIQAELSEEPRQQLYQIKKKMIILLIF